VAAFRNRAEPEFHGRLDLRIHDGFEQSRLGFQHGGLEGLARCQLEGQFARIHVVVGPVVDGDLEIDHGVAGQVAVGGGVHDAFFHSRNEILGDRTSKNFIGELENYFGRPVINETGATNRYDKTIGEVPARWINGRSTDLDFNNQFLATIGMELVAATRPQEWLLLDQ